MTKSLENMREAVRSPKQSFHKSDSQPRKQQRHRYERRKIRAYLQLTDWSAAEGY